MNSQTNPRRRLLGFLGIAAEVIRAKLSGHNKIFIVFIERSNPPTDVTLLKFHQ